MRMLLATRVAALALGLSLVGSQAFAADPPDARVRVDTNTPGPIDNSGAPADRAPTPTNPEGANEQNHSRADMTTWHRNFDAPRQYHAGAYNAPRDYSYRRYVYGQRLPRTYYDRSFWLADFLSFGLLAPPSGFVWVRYGSDALLVDEDTGEIAQVQYNVFYS